LKNRSILPVIIVVIVIIVAIEVFFRSSTVSQIAVSLVTVIGVFAVFWQLRQESVIAKGDFILSLESKYSESEVLTKIGYKLFNAHKLSENERMDIISYLTFFETVFLLISKRTIAIADIDELFRRRFFKAVMNPDIQRLELVTFDYGYKNIYLLNELWINYLDKINAHHSIDVHGVELSDANPYYSTLIHQSKLRFTDELTGKEGIDRFLKLIDSLPEKGDQEIFVAFDKSNFINAFDDDRARIMFVSEHGEDVAAGLVWFPQAGSADGDGHNLNLNPGEYGQIDNTIVIPAYRGNRLQSLIINRLTQVIFSSGVSNALATVSSKNPYSFRNFERSYYTYVKDVKFHGADRRLYLRKLFAEE